MFRNFREELDDNNFRREEKREREREKRVFFKL